MIRAYRICRRAYAAFDGEGARRKSGRWNQDGEPVVYTAATLSLAALEVLAHTDGNLLPNDLVYVAAEIPASIKITRLKLSDLPADWQQIPAPNATKELGHRWVREAKTVVLALPSAIITIEYNYLLNPAHPDFKKIRLPTLVNFSLDPRLFT